MPGRAHHTVGLALVSAAVATGCLVPYDFDGSGRADLAVWTLDGTWQRKGEAQPFFVSDHPELVETLVPGDYDGDGTWEAANLLEGGTWETSGGRGTFAFEHGPQGPAWWQRHVPVPANYDDDRATEPAWFSQADAVWHIEGQAPIQFGVGGASDPQYFDIPVPADYDGDKVDDLAVYRPADGSFHVQGAGEIATLIPVGYPVAADFDGDGRDEPAVAGYVPIDTSDPDPDEWTWEYRFVIAGESPVVWDDFDVPVPANFGTGPGDEVASVGPAELWRIEGRDPVVLAENEAPAPVPPWFIYEVIRLTSLRECLLSGEVAPC